MDEVSNVSCSTTTRTCPAIPAEVLGATQQARATAALPRRPEDLHDVRPDAAVRGAARDRRRSLPKSSQFTASLVVDRQRRRRRARDRERPHVRRRSSSTPRPTAPVARPARRSRRSRSRPRCRPATRPNDRCRRRRCSWRLGPGSSSDPFYNLSRRLPRRHAHAHAGDRQLRQLRVRAHRAVARPRQLRQRRREDGHRRWRSRWASTRRTSSRRVDDARDPGRAPARDGAGVLGARERRRAASAPRSSRRSSTANGKIALPDAGNGDAGARPRRSPAPRRRCSTSVLTQRHRGRRSASCRARGGQDGNDRPQPGRLVRRLHAAVHRRGVDGRPERRDPDDATSAASRCSARRIPADDLARRS